MQKVYLFIFIISIFTLIACNNTKTHYVNYYDNEKLITTIKHDDNGILKEIDHFKEDLIFTGYYLNQNLTRKIDLESFRVTEDIDIYLKYHENRPLNVLYIPLDNRPINKDRPILLSKAINC